MSAGFFSELGQRRAHGSLHLPPGGETESRCRCHAKASVVSSQQNVPWCRGDAARCRAPAEGQSKEDTELASKNSPCTVLV